MITSLFVSVLLGGTLLGTTPDPTTTAAPKENVSAKSEWISLFNGKNTKGWHSYGKETVGKAWKVEEGGILHLDASNKADWQTNGGGDLVHELELQDFHLKLEWKIAPKGNSGIIFWVQDDKSKYDYVWYTGPEMQVLDNDGHGDGKIIKHRAGNLYDLVAGVEGAVKPVGEWNLVDIINEKGTLNLSIKNSGNKHTSVMYTAPTKVNLPIIWSIYFAVCSPGLIPGTNAPPFFKLSAVSFGLKTKAV